MVDPRLAVMPDFGSEAFRIARQAIVAATNGTEEDAAGLLRQGWETDLQAKIVQWQLQQHGRQQGPRGHHAQQGGPGPQTLGRRQEQQQGQQGQQGQHQGQQEQQEQREQQ